MAYSADIFTSLEQPTLAKWNKLWDNDAFFASQINTNFSSGTTSKVWWEELGRQTLSGTSTTLTVSGLAARKYLKIIYNIIGSGATTSTFRLNGDSAANYSYRYSLNQAATTTAVSQTSAGGPPLQADAMIKYGVLDCINIATQEKMLFSYSAEQSGTGAASAPSFSFINNKWANTSAQISSIVFTTSTNNYASGSSLIVLGHD